MITAALWQKHRCPSWLMTIGSSEWWTGLMKSYRAGTSAHAGTKTGKRLWTCVRPLWDRLLDKSGVARVLVVFEIFFFPHVCSSTRLLWQKQKIYLTEEKVTMFACLVQCFKRISLNPLQMLCFSSCLFKALLIGQLTHAWDSTAHNNRAAVLNHFLS